MSQTMIKTEGLEKSAVKYQASAHGKEKCATCMFFEAGDTAATGACAKVKGDISADAWCAVWTPAA